MQVTVKLTPEAARKLRATAAARNAWVAEVRAAAGGVVDLAPIHDTDADPLGAYFRVEFSDARTAERVVNVLVARADVLGAYLTPKAELP